MKKNTRTEVVEKYIDIIYNIIPKYIYATNLSEEELINIGVVCILETYDSNRTKKYRFIELYIANRFELEILKELKKEEDYVTIFNADSVDVNKEDIRYLSSDEYLPINVTENDNEELDFSLSLGLNCRENFVLEKRFGLRGNDVFSNKEISDIIGCKPKLTENVKRKALRKLKNYSEGEIIEYFRKN